MGLAWPATALIDWRLLKKGAYNFQSISAMGEKRSGHAELGGSVGSLGLKALSIRPYI